jgi:TRAP-type C4-dicarboxylate transport system substrate-binding protein
MKNINSLKKIFSIILVLCMVFAMSACSKGEEKDVSSGSGEATTPEVIKPEIVIKVASQGSPGSAEIQTLDNFAKQVAEKSNGTMEIQIYPSGQLGALPDMIEGLSIGSIEMVQCGMTNLQQISPSFAAYDMWLYEDARDVIDVYNSEIGKQLNKDLIETAGVRMLSYINCSDGRMYLWSNTPIEKASDLDGLIIRTPGNKSISTAMSSIGTTTVIGFGDMYTAAQTGVIDVGSSGIPQIVDSGYDEVFDYCNEITPNYMALCLVVSEITYQSLTEEQQKIITDASESACQEWDNKLDSVYGTSMELLEGSNSSLVTMELSERAILDEKIHTDISAYLSEVIDIEMINAINEITDNN